MTQYIYSIYFSGTTMFTVGYGDILPINNVEILVILLIQFLGIFFSTQVLSLVDIWEVIVCDTPNTMDVLLVIGDSGTWWISYYSFSESSLCVSRGKTTESKNKRIDDFFSTKRRKAGYVIHVLCFFMMIIWCSSRRIFF